MEKLFKKLQSLAAGAKPEPNNGEFGKRMVCGGGAFSKYFTCDKVKYKIEMEAESKCDNTTHFIPTTPVIHLIDWRKGRRYTGPKQIAEFTGLSEEQVNDIYKDMIAAVVFTPEEIVGSINSFNNFMKKFKEDFLVA